MPMAVNVDQDTLFFLKDFFQGFSSAEDDESERSFGGKDRPVDDQPIFTVQPAREATEAEIQVNNRYGLFILTDRLKRFEVLIFSS